MSLKCNHEEEWTLYTMLEDMDRSSKSMDRDETTFDSSSRVSTIG